MCLAQRPQHSDAGEELSVCSRRNNETTFSGRNKENIVRITLSLPGVTCRLLITLANSLDPDQDGHSVGPDLDPSCLTL